MAKDMEETADDVVDNGAETRDTSGSGHREEAPAKLSIRESIQDGIDKAKEKEAGDVEDTQKQTTKDADNNKRSASKQSTNKEDDSTRKQSDKASESEDGKQVSKSEDAKETSQPTVKTKAPVGWTKEAKAKWDELPPEIQDSVLKREKEVSDGFAGTKQASERLQRLDAVIQPRLQAIQQFGVTPEQTIDKLFQWMEVLSHPNEGVRNQGFKTLADNFKINLTQFAPQQQTQTNDQTTQQQTTQNTVDPNPPAWAQSLIEQQQQVQQQIAIQRQQAAQDHVTNWAKDKPHFDKVRQAMFGLITSGTVPPKSDGSLDLDKAYDKAIRMDDEVWESIQSEKQEAKEREANEAAAKKKADAEKARKAGASIRPSAPTGNLNGSKSQVAKPKSNVSASQSIRDAIRELSEQ